MGLVALPSQLFPIDDSTSAVILLIGMAVGVDYSLFYMRREREERAAGHDPRTAVQRAAATSGRAVLISGLTVMTAMAGMFLSGDKTFIGIGLGAMLVVGVAMIGSLTVLPAMMAWLGDRVEKGRIPFVGRRRANVTESRMWGAIVDRVLKRPAISAVAATAILVALAIPALGMKTVQSSASDFPQDLPAVKAYAEIQESFPGKESAATVVIEDGDLSSGEGAAALAELERRALATGEMYEPIETRFSADNTVAEVSIPLAGDGANAESKAALAQLRDEIIPATVGQLGEVNVSGQTAQSVDGDEQLAKSMPLVFGFVLILAFGLLLVTFRSIVVPIKAIVLNLLSVGAAYGVLKVVFQDGLGEGLLGFESNGGITPWLPLFLFVVLFGLSMDYHVFILSRIREAVDRGMGTDEAVSHGIKTTAGTVTSAALVMVAVFSIFATLSMVDFKQMGVGLAVAILIDATVIRAVLLPATMKLLGEHNWYLPKFLGWMPRYGHEPATEPARA
jgi:RND superfamily putative drug exporter